jgi:hypothetical protein
MKSLMLMVFTFICILESPGYGKTKNHRQKPRFLPGVSTLRQIPRSDQKKGLMPSPPNQIVAGEPKPYSEAIASYEDFDKMASLSEGVVKSAGVKFLIDNRNTPAKVYFMNGNFTKTSGERPDYVQYHYYFARRFLGIQLDLDTFNQQTYFTNNLTQKKFIAGTLQFYQIANLNGEKQSLFGIQFYPQDSIAEETLLFAVQQLKSALQSEEYPLSFVSFGSQQSVNNIRLALQTINVKPMTIDQIYGATPYIPMQKGTTYGFLKLFPKGDALNDLGPMDIPVFDELPLDLSVVAGVITTVVQDAGAHVNLKSKERGTPNMILKDKNLLAQIEKYNNRPIKFVVGSETPEISPLESEQLSLEQAIAMVQKFHNDKMKDKKWVAVQSGKEQAIELFDIMASRYSPAELIESSYSYGGKASKLALLAHPKMLGTGSSIQKSLNYRLTPVGFAVPVDYYHQFVDANPELKDKLNQLINKEMGLGEQVPPSPQERVRWVKEIQDLFYKAEVPAQLVSTLKEQADALTRFAAEVFPKSPIKKVKVRSSSNAEDIPHFDGAGLHSSYSANINKLGSSKEICTIEITQEENQVSTKEKMVPNTLLCGIKGVYASLWNKRAIEERNFARIDQRSATMGLAVNLGYDFRDKSENINEIANAVVVTKIINAKGVYGYRISVNTEENLVTNPTPQTQSEIALATFLNRTEKPQFSYIQFAKPSAKADILTTPLLGSGVYERIIELSREAEYNYCRIVKDYYPAGDCSWVVGDPEKPSSLDMEFKIYSNGEVLLKQIREFSGE